VERGGLEPLTPHEARHTFASYQIASGMNPKQVQTYMGHTDIRTTYNVYGHLLDGDVESARAALDALLGPPTDALLAECVARGLLEPRKPCYSQRFGSTATGIRSALVARRDRRREPNHRSNRAFCKRHPPVEPGRNRLHQRVTGAQLAHSVAEHVSRGGFCVAVARRRRQGYRCRHDQRHSRLVLDEHLNRPRRLSYVARGAQWAFVLPRGCSQALLDLYGELRLDTDTRAWAQRPVDRPDQV
jgi:hypothetical protein